jgi:hypothetical protein
MPKVLSKMVVVAGVTLMVFVSHSLGSKQSEPTTGSTLVVPQGLHASEVKEAKTNIFVL